MVHLPREEKNSTSAAGETFSPHPLNLCGIDSTRGDLSIGGKQKTNMRWRVLCLLSVVPWALGPGGGGGGARAPPPPPPGPSAHGTTESRQSTRQRMFVFCLPPIDRSPRVESIPHKFRGWGENVSPAALVEFFSSRGRCTIGCLELFFLGGV